MVAEEALSNTAIPHCDELPNGIEITTRTTADAAYSFVFNNTDKAQKLMLNGTETELSPFEMKIDKM